MTFCEMLGHVALCEGYTIYQAKRALRLGTVSARSQIDFSCQYTSVLEFAGLTFNKSQRSLRRSTING